MKQMVQAINLNDPSFIFAIKALFMHVHVNMCRSILNPSSKILLVCHTSWLMQYSFLK